LDKYHIGDRPKKPNWKLKTRQIVDAALPLDEGAENVYFGAVELNGPGIRFYGDVCLVLRREAVEPNTIVLDRNSYDLVRAPIRDIVEQKPQDQQPQARKAEALKLCGAWHDDLGTMVALKAVQVLGVRRRRYTTGQVSEIVRDDEDYMEVLKVGTFGTDQLPSRPAYLWMTRKSRSRLQAPSQSSYAGSMSAAAVVTGRTGEAVRHRRRYYRTGARICRLCQNLASDCPVIFH